MHEFFEKPIEPRYKVLYVSPELVGETLFCSRPEIKVEGIPQDGKTRIQAVCWDDMQRCFAFRLWREDWDAVPAGEDIPEVQVTFTQLTEVECSALTPQDVANLQAKAREVVKTPLTDDPTVQGTFDGGGDWSSLRLTGGLPPLPPALCGPPKFSPIERWTEVTIKATLPTGKVEAYLKSGEPVLTLDYTEVEVEPGGLPDVIGFMGRIKIPVTAQQRHGLKVGSSLMLRSSSGHRWDARLVCMNEDRTEWCTWKSEGCTFLPPVPSKLSPRLRRCTGIRSS